MREPGELSGLKEFLQALGEKRILFYGCGFAAEMFYRGLAEQNLLDRVDGVVVTGPAGNREFHGFKVTAYKDTDTAGKLICLAVHNSIRNEIRLKPGDTGVSVYPFLYELLYGKCLEERLSGVEEILFRQPRENNWITLRYCGVRGLEEDSSRLTELYVRGQAMHSSRETARKRLEEMKRLLRSVKDRGLSPDYPILVDENCRIIDGLHRLAIARYLGIGEIRCRVYSSSPLYDELLGEKNRLTDDYLEKNRMGEEKRILRRYKEEMLWGKQP